MSSSHPLTMITLLATPIVAAVITCAINAEELGIDFWNVDELHQQIEQSEHQSRQMDEARQDTLVRSREREQIINDLLADRLTLSQAAQQFLLINRDDSNTRELLRIIYSQGTDLDRAHFQVFLHLRATETERASMLRCQLVADHPNAPTNIKQ